MFHGRNSPAFASSPIPEEVGREAIAALPQALLLVQRWRVRPHLRAWRLQAEGQRSSDGGGVSEKEELAVLRPDTPRSSSTVGHKAWATCAGAQ